MLLDHLIRDAVADGRCAALLAAGPTLTEDELVVRFELLEQLGIREIDIWQERVPDSALSSVLAPGGVIHFNSISLMPPGLGRSTSGLTRSPTVREPPGFTTKRNNVVVALGRAICSPACAALPSELGCACG